MFFNNWEYKRKIIMIVSVWKPVEYNKKVILYEQQSLNSLLIDKKTGYKVVYKCDTCGKISNTSSHVLYKGKYININKQICKSCRSIISNYKILKNTISYNRFKKILLKNNYTILTTKSEFESQLHPSQIKVHVICPEGHKHFVTWNNFISKGQRCRKCYEKNRSTVNKSNYDLYKHLVKQYTEKSFKKYFKGQIRDRYHHLDHKFSKLEGYKQGILPVVIGNYKNLEILDSKLNIRKYDKCSITKEELFNGYT